MKPEKDSAAPKKGKRKKLNHGMGGLFGSTKKKPEPDTAPLRRKQHAARMARLSDKRI